MAAGIKNEFLAAASPPPFHWPASIFAPPPQQSSQQQDFPWSSPGSIALSPLNDFSMPPDDEILSMSLDGASFQSGLTDEDEEQGYFMAAPPNSAASPSSSSSSNYQFVPSPSGVAGGNVLLTSVMRSKIHEIRSTLLSDDDDDGIEELLHDANGMVVDPSSLHHEQPIHRPAAPPHQAAMPPPPPLHHYPAQQGSFGTIRSFDFQQAVHPAFVQGKWHIPPAVQPASLPPSWMLPRGAAGVLPGAAALPHGTPRGDDPQVLLVQLLVMCAHAVAESNESIAQLILARLRDLTGPEGTPMERLASYFTEALAARIQGCTASALFKGLVSDKLLESDGSTQASMLEAFNAFYDYLPIGKFDHLTMNQVILDSVERERAIHILDLQLWFGTQWPALLQALATRPGGPPRVRITAIGSSGDDLAATGEKLRDCARALRVHLEFKGLLLAKADKFHAGLVSLHPGEAFVVNSLSQFHYILGSSSSADPDTTFAGFMAHIRALRPKVIVMAENDASHNSPDFLKRFGECLKYYSAVFDAMATCASSPGGRLKMERLFAAPKIRNIIACDGAERVERHESMADWSKRLEAAGFRAAPLSQRAVNQAKLLLRLYYTNGYTLHSERGSLVLGWRSLPLNTVSAWRVS